MTSALGLGLKSVRLVGDGELDVFPELKFLFNCWLKSFLPVLEGFSVVFAALMVFVRVLDEWPYDVNAGQGVCK